MNRMLFIQKPVNEIQSFTNSQYQEIIDGKKIHDANIESYRKNNDMLIRGNIDNKPIYYDSRQNRSNSFRNKKVSFSNSNSSNHPIMRDLTPFHLMIRPSRRNQKTHNRKYKQKSKKVKTQNKNRNKNRNKTQNKNRNKTQKKTQKK